ncbi:MAG: Type 1 glutamine amidotransferase-like domain-containing protein [Lachnospiraceae bacterium]|nr:Type 1 glutamine amidotransferase-like domain-containing protein [Lachnospiraceae bacterium]
MRKELLGVFSGFPDHHFPEVITKRLREELTERESLVFITACPRDYAQNDDDCDGMYEMFAEKGMPFAKHCVIDERTAASEAKELVKNASCIFLMGGGACLDQLELIREKGCLSAIRGCHAVIFGVSAGSMSMATNTVDFFDSLEPIEGLGFTNLTVSCHHDPADVWRYEQTIRMSEDRVVYAMEDESAFFIKEGRIDIIGNIYQVERGEFKLLDQTDAAKLQEDF